MNLLHFIDSLGPGGKERQFVELVKGIGKHSDLDQLVVIMRNDVFYKDILSVDRLKIVYLLRKWKYDPSIFHRLYRICQEYDPEVITSWDTMTAICAVPSAKKLRIPFINAMIQSAPSRISRNLRFRSLITFPFSDCILANSHAGLAAFGVSSDRARVIHNGYDMCRAGKLVPKEDMRRLLGVQAKYIVGMLANFRRTKDQRTLIKAAHLILEKRRDVEFVFCGDGETMKDCRDMVNQNFMDQFLFTGELASDVESTINIFDIGVLSTYTEGISNSIMEYMALGKPVIATIGGGTREIVIEGETGFLVRREDPQEMAEKIEFLLDNSVLREQMGLAGRERIRSEFSIDKMVDSFRRLYREMCPGGS